MDYKKHWANIYTTKQPDEVSWYQFEPTYSLDLIDASGIGLDAPIIDVGAGASTLVDHLLARGYTDVTLLDISGEALATTRQRLGANSELVHWIEDDATTARLPEAHFALWHDRAVFHFLTDPDVRARYVAQVLRSVKPGGHVIVATFATDGPEKCSGLEVVRYDADSLHGAFGSPFELVNTLREIHQTPWGSEQRFVYCYCRRIHT
jgi:SAM-dependent methyltransferase